jgi:hypothetical protein
LHCGSREREGGRKFRTMSILKTKERSFILFLLFCLVRRENRGERGWRKGEKRDCNKIL